MALWACVRQWNLGNTHTVYKIHTNLFVNGCYKNRREHMAIHLSRFVNSWDPSRPVYCCVVCVCEQWAWPLHSGNQRSADFTHHHQLQLIYSPIKPHLIFLSLSDRCQCSRVWPRSRWLSCSCSRSCVVVHWVHLHPDYRSTSLHITDIIADHRIPVSPAAHLPGLFSLHLNKHFYLHFCFRPFLVIWQHQGRRIRDVSLPISSHYQTVPTNILIK